MPRTTGRILQKMLASVFLLFLLGLGAWLVVDWRGGPWGTVALAAFCFAYCLRVTPPLFDLDSFRLTGTPLKAATALAKASSIGFAASSVAALVAAALESLVPNILFIPLGATMAVFEGLLARDLARHAA